MVPNRSHLVVICVYACVNQPLIQWTNMAWPNVLALSDRLCDDGMKHNSSSCLSAPIIMQPPNILMKRLSKLFITLEITSNLRCSGINTTELRDACPHSMSTGNLQFINILQTGVNQLIALWVVNNVWTSIFFLFIVQCHDYYDFNWLNNI